MALSSMIGSPMTEQKDWKYKEPVLAIYYKPADANTNTFDDLIGNLVYVQEFHEESRGYHYFKDYYHVTRCEHNDKYKSLMDNMGYYDNALCMGKTVFTLATNHALGKRLLDKTDR